MKKLAILATLPLMANMAYAKSQCQTNAILPNHQAGQFEIISDGAEVYDKATDLVWQRCSVGQTWNGKTCTGKPTEHTWQQAMTASQSLGNGYRLPNIKELASIANYQCHEPAVDWEIFPETSDGDYWSSSPYMGGRGHAWGVSFYIADINYYAKENKQYVRAVRAK